MEKNNMVEMRSQAKLGDYTHKPLVGESCAWYE